MLSSRRHKAVANVCPLSQRPKTLARDASYAIIVSDNESIMGGIVTSSQSEQRFSASDAFSMEKRIGHCVGEKGERSQHPLPSQGERRRKEYEISRRRIETHNPCP